MSAHNLHRRTKTSEASWEMLPRLRRYRLAVCHPSPADSTMVSIRFFVSFLFFASVESKASCLHQGTVYHSNERWEVDECTGCVCLSGNVHCHSERCPPLACATVSNARAHSSPSCFFFYFNHDVIVVVWRKSHVYSGATHLSVCISEC